MEAIQENIGPIILFTAIGLFGVASAIFWIREARKPAEYTICPHCYKATEKWIFDTCNQCGAHIDRHSVSWVKVEDEESEKEEP